MTFQEPQLSDSPVSEPKYMLEQNFQGLERTSGTPTLQSTAGTTTRLGLAPLSREERDLLSSDA